MNLNKIVPEVELFNICVVSRETRSGELSLLWQKGFNVKVEPRQSGARRKSWKENEMENWETISKGVLSSDVYVSPFVISRSAGYLFSLSKGPSCLMDKNSFCGNSNRFRKDANQQVAGRLPRQLAQSMRAFVFSVRSWMLNCSP